jgi:hypothetical protein
VYELQSEDARTRGKCSIVIQRRSSTYVCPSNEPSKIISARTRTFRSGIRPENRQASGVGMHQGTTRLYFDPTRS